MTTTGCSPGRRSKTGRGGWARLLLHRDLSPGDRVAVIARNCIEWPEISFGLAKAGLIAVPVNIRLAPDEVAHILDDSGARARDRARRPA